MEILIVLICASTVLGATGLIGMFYGQESNFKAWLEHHRDLKLSEHRREDRREVRAERLLTAAEDEKYREPANR